MKKEEKISLLVLISIIIIALLFIGNYFLKPRILPSPLLSCNINQAIQEKLSQGLNELVLSESCVLNEVIDMPVNFILDGNNFFLIADNSLEQMIRLQSSFNNIYGNNIVRNLKLDGNEKAIRGIRVIGRSNVTISDIEIIKTRKEGIGIAGGYNWEIFSIEQGVYNECPNFNLNINFSSRDKDMNKIYDTFKTCPNFPNYIKEIAKDITIEKVTITNSFVDNLDVNSNNNRYSGLINVELVHNIKISDSYLEGKNVYGIKVFWWASSPEIFNNVINIIEDGRDISPSLGIEAWSSGPFVKIYNNNVSRWISIYEAPNSDIYDNRIEFKEGSRSYGIEVVESKDSRIYKNKVIGATIGISIDRTNENVIFENNTILDSTEFGMQVVNCHLGVRQCNNITIRKNIIEDVFSGESGMSKRGIFLNHGNITNSKVENNIIKNTGGSAIYLLGTENTVVRNNFIYCYNKYPSPPGAEDDIYLNDARNTVLENNTIVECIKCTDSDLDGFNVEGGDCGLIDCNDNNSSIYPNASDRNCDGIDQNCDGKDYCLECTDSDGGISEFVKGTAIYYGTQQTTSISDSCYNNKTLKEYFCDPYGRVRAKLITCGLECKDGVCK